MEYEVFFMVLAYTYTCTYNNITTSLLYLRAADEFHEIRIYSLKSVGISQKKTSGERLTIQKTNTVIESMHLCKYF